MSSCGGCAPPVDTSAGINIGPCGSSTASILRENEDSRQVSEQITAATSDEVSKTTAHKSRKVGRWRSQGSRIPRPSSRKITHPRTLNSMLCGCLSSRVDHAVPSESPIAGASVQLLPSSVLQSMKRLSLTFNGDYDLSTESTKEPSQTPCHKHSTLNLPSSAIFTDILSHSKVEKQHGLKNTGVGQRTKRDRSLWRNFRLHRRKEPGQKPNGGSANPPCTTSNNSVDQLPDDQVLELSDQQNSDVNEALVFSPLPSQAIPEPTSADHFVSPLPTGPLLVDKVDVNLLYKPRFETLFRRHTALLGPRNEKDKGKKCFVIDLDETLVHSSFKVVEQADFKVGVEIDGITHRVYVLKRPHVDVFLSTMANLYECVLFTASLAKYADPVADFIDKWNAFRYRLFRESCVYHRGNYVKDLSHLGRPINQVVILDNSPASYMFHANHAVQISSWFDDANDHVLLDLIPYFERLASHPNVVEFLRTNPPPTPYAAVGTVGLPPSVMTQPSPPADMAGRSVDSSAVISNIRRPAVASPLPVPTLSTRAPSRPEVQCCPEPRKGQPATVQRVLPANALPVITKLAAPSSGPYIGPTKPKNESAASFPAPLCLATSSSVTPPSSYPVSVSNSTSGTSSQGRVPNPLNNSHNFPGTVGRGTSSSTGTTTSLTSLLRPYRPSPLGLMGPQMNSKVSTLSTSKMLTKQRQSDDNAPTCAVKLDDADRKTPAPSLVSENQYPILSTVPRQIGTVKSVVGDAPPVQTISPLAALAHVSTSTQRIHP